ncbi:MAG: hypothetical protein HXX18_10480 [Bacteroidetes bacterium]|nr:hypothetical protein [Bacteroidota bacterium]
MRVYSNILKLIFIGLIGLVGCKSKMDPKQAELLKIGVHTVTVQEIIQTSQYTYFRLKEEGNPQVNEKDTLWAAVPKTDSKIGETLYYKGGYPMKDFVSKELNRTFKEVLFLDNLSKTSDFVKKEMAEVSAHGNMSSSDSNVMNGAKPKMTKIEVKIDPIAGGVKIADLYAKKASYSGKTIKVKGQVTKFSPDIMEKNWIHIQDGTESEGKFDLTITGKFTAKVGDIVTLEGKIALNKDLGYDYFYEVIMEDAKIVK